MDKLRAMKTFVQIADDGSLTAAAAALGMSLPAVVRSLAALEAELGARLFQRTTRRLALTQEGLQYLARSRDILAAVAEADASLADETQAPRGQLTITAPVLLGQRVVADFVTRFVAANPRIRCSVQLLDRFVDLVDEGVDVGIRIGALEDSSLVALRLGEVRQVVVASPQFLRRTGTPRHPSELRARPCVRLAGPIRPGLGVPGRRPQAARGRRRPAGLQPRRRRAARLRTGRGLRPVLLVPGAGGAAGERGCASCWPRSSRRASR